MMNSDIERDRRTGIRKRSNPACFVCGSQNPSGIHLAFREMSSKVVAEWVPNHMLESFEGTIHGGIIAAVMDEAMSQAIMARNWEAVTAELNVRYRAYVAPGESLFVSGWVVSRRKKLIKAEASVRTPDGEERAHAWGTFLAVREQSSETLQIVSEEPVSCG